MYNVLAGIAAAAEAWPHVLDMSNASDSPLYSPFRVFVIPRLLSLFGKCLYDRYHSEKRGRGNARRGERRRELHPTSEKLARRTSHAPRKRAHRAISHAGVCVARNIGCPAHAKK